MTTAQAIQNQLLRRLAKLDPGLFARLCRGSPTMHQLTQSAVCSRFHGSVQRLARWLTLTAERAGTNRLHLTHEFVAQMVGAPRSAVTAAAAELRARKIIEYGRGTVIIKSVKRLHNSACDCVDAVRMLQPE